MNDKSAERQGVIFDGAFSSLFKVFETIGRAKINEIEFVYLCARVEGIKQFECLMDLDEAQHFDMHDMLGRIQKGVTTFEVELLSNPKRRVLDCSKKNQWNSLRGKRGMRIEYAGKVSMWSGLEMITRNISFPRAAMHHINDVKSGKKKDQLIPVLIYECKQYLCICDSTKKKPIPLYRGNQVVNVESINRKNFKTTMTAMSKWLGRQVKDTGKANYKYWPSRGEYSIANNPIRQWMATICLNRCAIAFNDRELKLKAELNIEYNIREMFRWRDDIGYIWMSNSAKLGAASLAALAVRESVADKKYIREVEGLRNLINLLTNKDGSFDTFYIPRERKDNQNFYSGEALLYLATVFTLTNDENLLSRYIASFKYYKEWHYNNRNPAFVPWHTQANFLVWKKTNDERLKEFIFEINDWLLSMQQWEGVEYMDMKGRFYDPKNTGYGPPHASATGVYLEGLIDAFQLAKVVNDKVRQERYRLAILRGVRSIMQLQYKNLSDYYYITNRDNVIGGVRTTVYDNTIRIDNVQHALMAFLKIYSRFVSNDYIYSE